MNFRWFTSGCCCSLHLVLAVYTRSAQVSLPRKHIYEWNNFFVCRMSPVWPGFQTSSAGLDACPEIEFLPCVTRAGATTRSLLSLAQCTWDAELSLCLLCTSWSDESCCVIEVKLLQCCVDTVLLQQGSSTESRVGERRPVFRTSRDKRKAWCPLWTVF